MNHPTRALANFVSATRYEDLPPSVVHEAKRLLLDTIGNTMAGSVTDIGNAAVAFVRSQGGKPDCTLIGYGDRTSAVNAAYCNARTGDALDATDMLMHVAHIGCSISSSALAMCEERHASGKDLITSIAVGFEVAGRLAVACGFPPPLESQQPAAGDQWIRMPSIEFGAAAAAAKALDLREDEIVNAFGVTAANASIRATKFRSATILPTINIAISEWRPSTASWGH